MYFCESDCPLLRVIAIDRHAQAVLKDQQAQRFLPYSCSSNTRWFIDPEVPLGTRIDRAFPFKRSPHFSTGYALLRYGIRSQNFFFLNGEPGRMIGMAHRCNKNESQKTPHRFHFAIYFSTFNQQRKPHFRITPEGFGLKTTEFSTRTRLFDP